MPLRKILKDTCVLAALMIFCVFAISIVWVGMTDEIRLVIRLFVLSFIISLVNYLIDEYTVLPILGIYAVKYISASAIVMLFGFITGWFYKSNFWMAFIYVGIVIVMAYFIDAVKTKKDIEFINSHIKSKR